jgi:hypothetical protein
MPRGFERTEEEQGVEPRGRGLVANGSGAALCGRKRQPAVQLPTLCRHMGPGRPHLEHRVLLAGVHVPQADDVVWLKQGKGGHAESQEAL